MIIIIYIIVGLVKEKVSLKLGGGLSQCYIHAPIMSSQDKLLFKKFMLGFLSINNRSMLDTSCTGSFMMKTIEFKWDLLERIKCNSEDWDLDEGKESGITPKFDCVKSFMDTDDFREFSTKYGLDSEIVASFCESFATHVDLPKEKWFKYNPLVEVKVVAPIKVEPSVAMVKISWPIILMGMLFTSAMKLLELLDSILKINIDLL